MATDWDALMRQPVLRLSDRDSISLEEMCTGALITGATGAGKSAFVLRNFVLALGRMGCGFLFTCVKPGDADYYTKLLEEAGRGDDIVRLRLEDDGWRFPFLAHEWEKTKSTTAVLDLLMTAVEARDRQRGHNQDSFFLDNQRILATAGLDLLTLAGETPSLPKLSELIASAPQSREEATSPAWQSSSYCNALIDKALARRDLSPVEENTLTAALQFFLSSWPSMGDRTRSSIEAGVSGWTFPFCRGPLRRAFSGQAGKVVSPEMLFEGKCVILDMPLLAADENHFPQLVFKEATQRVVCRRDVRKHPRPVVIVSDEAQLTVTKRDSAYQSVMRSFRGISLYLTQSRPAFLRQFGGDQGKAYVDELWSNLRLKVCLNTECPDTAEFFSKLVGESWQMKAGVSSDLSNGRAGFSTQEHKDWILPPYAFRMLGAAKVGKTNALVIRVGEPFRATDQPFIRTTFRLDPRTVEHDDGQ